MKRVLSRRKIAALAISLAVAVAAGAQIGAAQQEPKQLPGNPQIQNRPPDHQHDRRGTDARRDGENRLDRRVAFLHTQLRITPTQESAWAAFVNELRNEAPNPDLGLRERDRSQGAPSVVERLERREKMLAGQSAELDRTVRALRPLYASFSEEQRKTADRLMFKPRDGRFGGPREQGFRDGKRDAPGLGAPG